MGKLCRKPTRPPFEPVPARAAGKTSGHGNPGRTFTAPSAAAATGATATSKPRPRYSRAPVAVPTWRSRLLQPACPEAEPKGPGPRLSALRSTCCLGSGAGPLPAEAFGVGRPLQCAAHAHPRSRLTTACHSEPLMAIVQFARTPWLVACLPSTSGWC